MRNVFFMALAAVALSACTGGDSRGQVSLRLKQNGKALSSAGALILSPNYCYALHVSGAKIDRWNPETPPSCAQAPGGIGQFESFFSPGQSILLEVKVGKQRRFDLLAVAKASLPGGDCSSRLRVDTVGAKNWTDLKPFANESPLSSIRLVATGVADVNPADNVVELTAQGSDASGVEYGCGAVGGGGTLEVASPPEGATSSNVMHLVSGTCSGASLAVSYGPHAFGPANVSCSSGNFSFGLHLAADQTAGVRSFTITGDGGGVTRSFNYTPRLWTPNAHVKTVLQNGANLILGGEFLKLSAHTGAFGALSASTGQRSGYWDLASEHVLAMISDGMGGYIIGGKFRAVGGLPRSGLARIMANGHVDPLWVSDINNSGWVTTLALIGSELVVGGQFGTINGQSRTNLASINIMTRVVSAWDPAPPTSIETISVHPDGSRFYVGGSFLTISGQARTNLAAYDNSFNLDMTWNPNINAPVLASALDLVNSRLYIGGSFTNVNAGSRNRIAAVEIGGSGATNAWYPSTGADNNVMALAFDSDNSLLYVGGSFITIGGALNDYMAAVDMAGTVLPWDPSANGLVSALAIDPFNNRILIGGQFENFGGSPRSGLAAISRTDRSLQSWTNSPSGLPKVILPQPDLVWVGGSFYGFDALTRRGVAELDPSTGAPTAFSPNIYHVSGGGVFTMALDPSWLYVGGNFTFANGTPKNNLVRVDRTTGSMDASFISAGAPNSMVNSVALSGTTLYVGGNFTNINAQTRNRLAAIDTSTGSHTMWNPNANASVSQILIDGITVYVAGQFATVGGQPRSYLASLDNSMGNATSWDPSPNNFMSGMHLDGSDLYIGGLFTNAGGQSRGRIAAIDTTSAAATAFNPNANNNVGVIAGDATQLYVAGNFTSVGGAGAQGFAILDKSTGVQVPVGLNFPANSITSLTPIGSKLYIGGGFLTAGPNERPFLAVYDIPTQTIE